MLRLTVYPGMVVRIGEIKVEVFKLKEGRMEIGIDAPREMAIDRVNPSGRFSVKTPER